MKIRETTRKGTPLEWKHLKPQVKRHCGVVNPTEARFAEKALLNGWSFLRRGWPDFFCWKDDELMLVEVKTDNEPLKYQQLLILQKFAAHGIKCFKWTPGGNLEKINAKSDKAG